MNILADTHILIWALSEDEKLPEKCRELFCPKKTLYFLV